VECSRDSDSVADDEVDNVDGVDVGDDDVDSSDEKSRATNN
jgi:hypothetical protein